ncbi:MAG: hypothetical protein ACW99G_02525 [Candidatus Thorarchaeota archaeon]|jgi:calcineurin-like phosphoesterase family protein
MARWITADWHLGEDRFGIMQRPGFTNAQHMVDEFVRLHNELVAPDDLVYVVGDACNLKTPEFLPQVSKFNGKKTLFRGNHDRPFSDEQLLTVFDEIIPEGDGLEIKVGSLLRGLPCWITHYPTQSRSDLFNLVGHIHAAWKVQFNALNVGVDCNHYRPHNVDKDVPFFFTAIRDHYDNDVWVAYDKSQMSHCNRGKDGRYLDQDGLVGGGS